MRGTVPCGMPTKRLEPRFGRYRPVCHGLRQQGAAAAERNAAVLDNLHLLVSLLNSVADSRYCLLQEQV